ncbi:peptide/nickel transport system substrate-binding protein [Nocardia fluminea]|uniref:Peptide/nickel transport system substrate-binding protein n=1 Tax=Nocardia fluminea TaxID=134984 RepID=A0A2N3VDT1_9NOCA|nr:peptide/nickel transport system substrate-binding protein [Nocardia fluminea]
MRHRRLLATALVSAVAVLAAACGGTDTAARESAQPVSGGSLTWGVETEPTTLNPHLNGQSNTHLMLRNVFESLLARTTEGGFVGWLATGHEISPDGLTYTFPLREGVKFTDGNPLTATAVARNFTTMQDVSYSGGWSAGPLSHLAAVTARDERTVVFTLKDPYAPFLDFAAGFPLISPAAWDKPQLKAGGPEIAGTGPFVLDRYVKGQELHFRKNPDYNWAPQSAKHQGPAYLDEVTYRFLPESSVRTGALTSGQVDLIEGVSGNDAALFRDNPDFTYSTGLNNGSPYTLYWNATFGPATDERVRKALNNSVDVNAVLQSIYRGERTRGWGIASSVDTLFYDKSIEGTYGADKAAANRLLDEAGWTAKDSDGFRTKDGQRLTIELVQAQSTVRDQREVLLQAVQAQAKQNAGIDLKLSYVDLGTYSELRKKNAFGSIANSDTITGGIDIENHWYPPTPLGTLNYSRATDPELSTWLRAAASTTDTAERAKQYAQLQRFAIVDKAYGLPLYIPENQIATGAHVYGAGYRPYKQLPENAYDIWVDRG